MCFCTPHSASSQSIANSNGQRYIEQLGILWPLKYSRVYHYLGAKKTRAVGLCQAITNMIKYSVTVIKHTKMCTSCSSERKARDGTIVTKIPPKYVPLVQVRGRLETEPSFYQRLHIERYHNSSTLTRPDCQCVGYTRCSLTTHVPKVWALNRVVYLHS